jgi:hypothetical protein
LLEVDPSTVFSILYFQDSNGLNIARMCVVTTPRYDSNERAYAMIFE